MRDNRNILGALVCLLGLLHPTHLLVAYFRYNEVTDDKIALLIGIAFNGIISMLMLVFGVLLIATKSRVAALTILWIYGALITLGIVISAALDVYETKLVLLFMQLALSAYTISIAVAISRLDSNKKG